MVKLQRNHLCLSIPLTSTHTHTHAQMQWFSAFYSFVIDHSFISLLCLLSVHSAQCTLHRLLYAAPISILYVYKQSVLFFFLFCHVRCSYDLRMWIRFCNFLMTFIQFEYEFVSVRMRACTRAPANALLFCRHFNISLCPYVSVCVLNGCMLVGLVCLWRLSLKIYACVNYMEVGACALYVCVCQLIAIFSCRIFEYLVNYCRPTYIFNIVAYNFISILIFVLFIYLFVAFHICPQHRCSFRTLNHHISIALHVRIISGKQAVAWNRKETLVTVEMAAVVPAAAVIDRAH